MPRPDANRIALRAIRQILDAAESFAFTLLDQEVQVDVEPLPFPAWPRTVKGLDEAVDGSWPRGARVLARWQGGSVDLHATVGIWPSTDANYGDYVGIGFSVAGTGASALWVTVPNAIQDAGDGNICSLVASASLNAHKGEDWQGEARPYAERLKQLVAELDLPRKSTYRVAVFDVRVPEGQVLPSAAEAFRRLATLAVIKLPFILRGDWSQFEGELPLGLLPMETGPGDEPGGPIVVPEEKKAGLWHLPGGVRAYHHTLVELLEWVEREPRSPETISRHFEEVYEAAGTLSQKGYLRVLVALGLLHLSDGLYELTEAGSAYLADPTARRTFDRLHAVYTGILEPLVLADMRGAVPPAQDHAHLSQLLGVSWKSLNQVVCRRNWLLSLGLTDRRPDGDHLTAAGREVLAAYDVESAIIRAHAAAMLGDLTVKPPGPSQLEPDEPEDDGPKGEGIDGEGDPAPLEAAPAWFSERLVLSAELLQPHMGELVMPPHLLAQCAAALSAGKHLLLVGPPGTGKTRLAMALAAAARTEGYCAGLFQATASADWTTFDTIGGYALEKDSRLRFRSGVFLRAIEQRSWLLIDELNRADVDRAFGELMTVLSGAGTDTPYQLASGAPVGIGPEESRSHVVPATFRVVATMNTWDKTSLFRLSYAVQRRFAIIHLGLPDPTTYAWLVQDRSQREWVQPPLEVGLVKRLQALFHPKGLLGVRQVGPAVVLDMIRYMRFRQQSGDALAEAFQLFLLAQLEGLDPTQANEAWTLLDNALADLASDASRAELRARYLELFPGLRLSEA